MLPLVSICTPTYNRRKFIPLLIDCFMNQTYPIQNMEWVIVDDGDDKIKDLLVNVPNIRYFVSDKKISIGKKRNILNQLAKGDIIVYMDDDDFHHPDRVKHAVTMLLKNPDYMIAGCSTLYNYFIQMDKIYCFGPYMKNHSTAGCFAFKKELLQLTSFENDKDNAEEKFFLKNYTIPLLQLEPKKTILAISHNVNTFDRTIIINSVFSKETELKLDDFIKNKEIYNKFQKLFIELNTK